MIKKIREFVRNYRFNKFYKEFVFPDLEKYPLFYFLTKCRGLNPRIHFTKFESDKVFDFYCNPKPETVNHTIDALDSQSFIVNNDDYETMEDCVRNIKDSRIIRVDRKKIVEAAYDLGLRRCSTARKFYLNFLGILIMMDKYIEVNFSVQTVMSLSNPDNVEIMLKDFRKMIYGYVSGYQMYFKKKFKGLFFDDIMEILQSNPEIFLLEYESEWG